MTVLAGGGFISSIADYSVTIPSGTTLYGDVTITSVDTTRSIIFLRGYNVTTAYDGAQAENIGYLELTSSTNVRATKKGQDGGPITWYFTVVEFAESAVKYRLAEVVTITSTNTSIAGTTISPAVNKSNCLLVNLGFSANGNDATNVLAPVFCYSELNSGGTVVTSYIDTASSNRDLTTSYILIEFYPIVTSGA